MTDQTKPAIDWERIEADYRQGIKSVREIGAENGITHAGINKRAKKEGWDRDLSARIQAKADALVTKRQVSKEATPAKLETEKRLVEVAATAVAEVRLQHRTDIKRLREHLMVYQQELEEMEEAAEKPGLGVRMTVFKQIADTQKTLVGLEREAWGIQNSSEGQTPQTVTKIERVIIRK